MNKDCAVYRTVDFIGKRWTLLILLELYKGKNKWKRYSEIKKSLDGITPKILSMRLKELEKNKLIENIVDVKQFPIKSEYSLTKRGEDFIGIIKNIKKWSLKWKGSNRLCEEKDCKICNL